MYVISALLTTRPHHTKSPAHRRRIDKNTPWYSHALVHTFMVCIMNMYLIRTLMHLLDNADASLDSRRGIKRGRSADDRLDNKLWKGCLKRGGVLGAGVLGGAGRPPLPGADLLAASTPTVPPVGNLAVGVHISSFSLCSCFC